MLYIVNILQKSTQILLDSYQTWHLELLKLVSPQGVEVIICCIVKSKWLCKNPRQNRSGPVAWRIKLHRKKELVMNTGNIKKEITCLGKKVLLIRRLLISGLWKVVFSATAVSYNNHRSVFLRREGLPRYELTKTCFDSASLAIQSSARTPFPHLYY